MDEPLSERERRRVRDYTMIREQQISTVCKCGAEMQIVEEWMGPDNPLPYSFIDYLVCPHRRFVNFWKHSKVRLSHS